MLTKSELAVLSEVHSAILKYFTRWKNATIYYLPWLVLRTQRRLWQCPSSSLAPSRQWPMSATVETHLIVSRESPQQSIAMLHLLYVNLDTLWNNNFFFSFHTSCVTFAGVPRRPICPPLVLNVYKILYNKYLAVFQGQRKSQSTL